MTVVSTQWRWNNAVPWCSSPAATTEPWYLLDTQLKNWVNAIADPTKISVVVDPGQNTTRNSTTNVGWILSLPETGNHMQFMVRPGNATSAGATYPFLWLWGRTPGTGNNGMGTWTDSANAMDSAAITPPTATVRMIFFTAYEADVALPWFFVGYWPIDSLASGIRGAMLCRTDYSTGTIGANNPVPAGTSPWVLLGHQNSYLNLSQPADTRITGIKGTVLTGVTNSFQRDYDAALSPLLSYGNTLTEPLIPWGFRYPIGKLPDCLLIGSINFGLPLETIVYNTKTYIKLSTMSARVGYWLRIN